MSAATFRCPCGASIEAEASDLVALMNGHRCRDDGSAGTSWTGVITGGGGGGGAGGNRVVAVFPGNAARDGAA